MKLQGSSRRKKKKKQNHPRKPNRPRKRNLKKEISEYNLSSAATPALPGLFMFMTSAGTLYLHFFTSPAPQLGVLGTFWGRKLQSCSYLGVQRAPRTGHGVHPGGCTPFFGVRRWKREVEPRGSSRMTRFAGGRGRTCREGGRPGGSTRSPSAPATGVSRSSGGERRKGGDTHVLGVPVLPCIPSFLHNPPALGKSNKLCQKA